jgi:hypothetical protein
MWIVKGMLFGGLIFLVLFATRFHRIFYHNIIDPKIVAHITIQSVLFWTGLVGCLLLGCTIAGWWWWHPRLR